MNKSIFTVFFISVLFAPTPGLADEAGFHHAGSWRVIWRYMVIDLGLIGFLVGFVTMIILLIYTRRGRRQNGHNPVFNLQTRIFWAVIPIILILANNVYLSGKGWTLGKDHSNIPENAMVIDVEGYMYGWRIKYENGVTSRSEIVVPVGKPVALKLSSKDSVHSVYIPDFKINGHTMPGKTTYIWFQGDHIGEHTFTCGKFCGREHWNMYGKVKVVSRSQFDKWLTAQARKGVGG